MNTKTPVLLSYAFRPFFLLNGIFAILVVLLWILSLRGVATLDLPAYWHAHEMLVGFAMAAIAGFSLTAVANWTGRPAVHGKALGWLLFSWLLGRLAMLSAGFMQAEIIALLDLLFPFLLCVLLGREIFAGGSRRNYPLVLVLAVLALANVLYHLGALQLVANADKIAIYLLVHGIVLLVVVIAGRILPLFTANWLRNQGHTSLPVNQLNRTALLLTVLTGLAATFIPNHATTGILAILAFLVHGFRLFHWRGWACRSNPLLFILHVAYAWIPIGYLLMGLAIFGWLFSPAVALHALTMGAIGGMILAVTTRVSLGHTGRLLQAARLTVIAYWVFMLAVCLRVFGPAIGLNYLLIMELAASGWMLAFGLFVWSYLPILTRPRPDISTSSS